MFEAAISYYSYYSLLGSRLDRSHVSGATRGLNALYYQVYIGYSPVRTVVRLSPPDADVQDGIDLQCVHGARCRARACALAARCIAHETGDYIAMSSMRVDSHEKWSVPIERRASGPRLPKMHSFRAGRSNATLIIRAVLGRGRDLEPEEPEGCGHQGLRATYASHRASILNSSAHYVHDVGRSARRNPVSGVHVYRLEFGDESEVRTA
ncbi:hypothetical protein B0H17DRAFT_1149008 [Mycena rosella]|uniref:Uncharacterized protein n=1 Tax=Mycena rosella TaxID=1033263 RepID=A0AAD7C6K3_MYCRO|nr:hypothetical protein B0H17DRAFT_1149008 [Mycena rosella]